MGYEIISSKHLMGKCVMNGRHNMVERFRRVTITNVNMVAIERQRDRQAGSEMVVAIERQASGQ